MGQLNIKVDDKVLENLGKMARAASMPPSTYARVLFDAAYAARCGKSPDEDLNATVAAALILSGAELDSAAIARALKCSEATVVRISQAWRKFRGGADDRFVARDLA
jgi:hypothetical protein